MNPGSDTFPDEDILPDDYPIYGGYLYVADGKLFESPFFSQMTVARVKAKEGFKEIRRCNIPARQAARAKQRVG